MFVIWMFALTFRGFKVTLLQGMCIWAWVVYGTLALEVVIMRFGVCVYDVFVTYDVL